VEEAREWWFGFWEDEIAEYYYAPRLGVACVAKSGTWRSLSPWAILRHKDEFQIIKEEELRKLVGERRFSDMLHEHMYLGISVRCLNF
jgi:hypothetical protein